MRNVWLFCPRPMLGEWVFPPKPTEFACCKAGIREASGRGGGGDPTSVHVQLVLLQIPSPSLVSCLV